MTVRGDEYLLSAEECAAFARDGYLVLDDVVTEQELAPLEAIFGRFMRGEVAGMRRDFCDMSGPYTRPFDDFNIINAVLPRTYEPLLVDNVFERRAASIGRQLIGDDIALDYDQFLTKKPQRPDAIFAWHQDLGYWPSGTPDTRTTTCSLALDDATVDNGCLRVVPGSQREPALRRHRPAFQAAVGDVARDAAHTLAVVLEPTDSVVYLPVKRRGITVHDERIVHGSGGNPSATWRRTYVLAHRSQATVDHERALGFTHSHNDRINWKTHLEALG